MFPGMNSRKLQQTMRRMGIQQSEIDAKEVVIKCDDKEIIISNPQVSKVNMMGQETFQIIGEATEREISSHLKISDDDLKIIMGQTGADKETARKKLEEASGDIAKAILSLKN